MEKIEIESYSPCEDGLAFVNLCKSYKDAWDTCQRGDWMLWISQKLNVDLLKLTTAKALCANTVRHLMKDERSTKAIDVALLFGQGKATKEELKTAAAAADAAAAASYAAAAAADAADAAADAADAKTKNQLQTANICRTILTEEIYKALNYERKRRTKKQRGPTWCWTKKRRTD